MEKWLIELGRLSLRLMEVNRLSADLYSEKKDIESKMQKIQNMMIEHAGKTGETIGEVNE